MSDQPLKIVELKSTNVKRLTAVRITPDGNLVVVGGNNGQGKTSVLDSIMYALGGKSAACAEPIHKGKKKAEVVVDLGELVVTRTFTAKGGTLTVATADGAKVASPQALLDKLVGKLSFDPLEFDRMDPRQQRATLVDLVGLDFTDIDKRRKAAYDTRTDVNRALKAAQAKLDAAETFDVPADAPSAAEAVEAYRKAQEDEATFAIIKRQAEGNKARRAAIVEEIKALQNESAALEKTFANMQAEANKIPQHDLDALKAAVDNAEGLAEKVHANKRAAELTEEVEALEDESDDLTQAIERADEEKARALASAQFPVEGLAFTDDGVTLAGVPFEQASAAERLRVSVAMGLALNPRLRVMLIRDGSLLDEKSLDMLAQLAVEHDAQVWLERVGHGAECTVVIEDGEVAEVRQKVEA